MHFTNAKVGWRGCERVNGIPIQDAYGELRLNEEVLLQARKQPMQELVRMTDGREYLSKTVYYFDPRFTPEATRIKELDKIDGETVVDTYVMCDLLNRPRMVRVRTT